MGSDQRLLMVCGGRTYDDDETMRADLAYFDYGDWVLITGAARGADRMAEDIWRDWSLPYIGVPAVWPLEGKAAGILRTDRILRGNAVVGVPVPNLVVALPGGKGTAHTVRRAQQLGIPVRKVGWVDE